MAAAAAVGFYLKGRGRSRRTARPMRRGPARSPSVARASADKTGGLEVCDANARAVHDRGWRHAVRPGATLRTDARTRART